VRLTPIADSTQDGDRLEAVMSRMPSGFDAQDAVVHRCRVVTRINRPFSEVFVAEFRRGDADADRLVIKFFKPRGSSPDALARLKEKLHKDFEITTKLFGVFREYPQLTTAEPIAIVPDALAIVMRESRGVNLRDLIAKKARLYPRSETLEKLREQLYRCGEWLRLFQGITGGAAGEMLMLPDLVADIDHRLRKLQARGFLDPAVRSAVLAYVENQASLVKQAELGLSGVHADFSPSNVLVDGRQVTVLDFTMYRLGSIYHDVTYFHRYLENFLLKPTFRPESIAALQKAFLQGYGGEIHSDTPIFRIFKIRHVVCHLVGLTRSTDKALHKRWFDARAAGRYREWLAGVTR
jgi:hypothetical protein